MMYIRDLAIFCDESIIDYYRGGFCQMFHTQTLCITEHLISEIYQRIRTDKISKIIFSFYHPEAFSKIIKPDYEDARDGVTHWHAAFDFDLYHSSNFTQNDRKQLIAESFRTALIPLCQHFLIDFTEFDAAFHRIADKNYRFDGYSKQRWTSFDKKTYVRLHFEYHLEKVSFEAIVYRNRKGTELGRRFLADIRPTDNGIGYYLQSVKWLSDYVLAAQTGDFARREAMVDLSEFMQ